MKKNLLLLPLLLLAIFSSPALAAEKILSFHSDIRVREDASMTVTETIRVAAEGNQIKRGIYRDFPTDYRDDRGNLYTVGFRVTGVLRDGRKEPYHTERVSNGERVYIGQSKVFLSPGEYTYTITYRTDRQLGFFEDHDELYWNVTGNGWSFPIGQASAVLDLPGDASANIIKWDAFTGYQGAKGKDFETSRDALGRLTLTATRPLNPQEGFTIVVAWPKGYVRAPPPRSGSASSYTVPPPWYQRAPGIVLVCVLGLVVLLGYYLSVWSRYGKDPARGTIIPLFEPPAKLSPAAVRYLMKMECDNKTFSAALIAMAVKGFLKIEEKGKKYTLRLDSADYSKLTTEEDAVARGLFRGLQPALELDNDNYAEVGAAMSSLRSALAANMQHVYFFLNRKYFFLGILISLLFGWGLMSMIAFAYSATEGPLCVTVTVVLVLIINGIFFNIMKAPTISGRQLMDRVEGFKMFLSVTEKDRLNLLNPPEITPQLFEKYLPYALALDVEQKWAEKFTAALAAASLAPDSYSPVWYTGRSWDRFSPAGFVSHVSHSLPGVIASSSTPPGSSSGFSSGGGGGGFSGGGGGGGGGGGW
ncbi:MAG: DUF2207 domain-containing protein [Candidatus Omnitrophota bacterium]|nr:DUF2207 domain-containing protein [Candidatus Omnitrophota bacterium]